MTNVISCTQCLNENGQIQNIAATPSPYHFEIRRSQRGTVGAEKTILKLETGTIVCNHGHEQVIQNGTVVQ